MTSGKRIVIIVLHGGLGNQLFQYYFTKIKARQLDADDIRLISDFLGSYSSPRSIELLPLVDLHIPGAVQMCNADLLLQARLPKVIKRLTGREIVLSVPGYGTILDGYFQELRHYQDCSLGELAAELASWRRILTRRLSLNAPGKGRITHIRLGDFFDDIEAARSFAVRQMSMISGSTDLVTDQEDVLADELSKLDLAYSVRLLPSKDMSAWELMALMCRYESISTNGSTLAFWAAVMRSAELESTNQEHMSIWRLMMKAGEFVDGVPLISTSTSIEDIKPSN